MSPGATNDRSAHHRMDHPPPRNFPKNDDASSASVKKPSGGDLNFYLNFILDNINSNHSNDELDGTAQEIFEENVTDVLTSILEVVQDRSVRFARAFQPVIPSRNSKLNVEIRNGEKHATIPIFLNRPLYPDMFEVQTGQLCGLPPGFALYRLRRCTSAEEQRVTRKMWRGCLDKNDFVSPLKIYPWFAKAILDAIVYLRERDAAWSKVRFRLHAVFPEVHLTIKVSKQTPLCLLSDKTSAREHSFCSRQSRFSRRGRSARSPDFKTESGTPRDADYRSIDTPTSMYTSLKTDDLEAYSLRIPVEDSKSTNADESFMRKSPDAISAGEDYVDPVSARDSISRNSNLSTLDPRMKLSFVSTDRDATDIIHLHLVPSMDGFGWPKGARFPQLLPSQRPWSIMTKEWTIELKEKIKDGHSFWGLRAVDPKELGSMYLGRYVPLWRINFAAANDFMAMKINQMPVVNVLDDICGMLNQMNNGLGSRLWPLLGDRAKKDIKLRAIKLGIHINKTLPDWFQALLSITITHMKMIKGTGSSNHDGKNPPVDLKSLINYMQELKMICEEEPRKLIEMINMNNENILSPSGTIKVPEQQKKYLRTSTPLEVRISSRASAHDDEKSVGNTKVPGKKPRMLYRLFRKDF